MENQKNADMRKSFTHTHHHHHHREELRGLESLYHLERMAPVPSLRLSHSMKG